jgi:translation initiation factor IF-1
VSRDDLTRVEGTIAAVLAGGHFTVTLDNGQSIRARISGRLQRFHVKVIVGDRVTVGISPYDASHGLIMTRGANPSP